MKHNNRAWTTIHTIFTMLFACLTVMAIAQQVYENGQAKIIAATVRQNSANLGATNGLPARLTDGTGFMVPVYDTNFNARMGALLTELQLKADLTETQPVSAASLPLPSGASTEATLLLISANTAGQTNRMVTLQTAIDAINANTAGQTNRMVTLQTAIDAINVNTVGATNRLASLLTELQLKADLTETQPVSLASIPLATDAATDTQSKNITNRLASVQTTLDGLTNRVANLETYMINLTNNVRGAYQPGLWLPSAAVSSNLVKSTATRLRYIWALNTNVNGLVFLKMYSGSAAGNPSANTPVQTWGIPYSTNGQGYVISLPGAGIDMPSGAWIAVTGGRATNDNTTPVGPVDVNYGYD